MESSIDVPKGDRSDNSQKVWLENACQARVRIDLHMQKASAPELTQVREGSRTFKAGQVNAKI